MFTIRPTTAADADAITALFSASYGELLRGSYDDGLLASALPLITRAQPKLLESGTFYVALDRAGTIAACGGWTKERPGSGDVEPGLGHLRHFGTHPDFTRRGAGRAIAHRCFEDAAAQGVKRLECYSTLMAERFYASLGFVRVEAAILHLPGDIAFPQVFMRRGLVAGG